MGDRLLRRGDFLHRRDAEAVAAPERYAHCDEDQKREGHGPVEGHAHVDWVQFGFHGLELFRVCSHER